MSDVLGSAWRACAKTLTLLALLAGCALGVPGATGQPEVADQRLLIVLTAPPAEPLIEASRALGYGLRDVTPLGELDDILVSLEIPEGRTIPEAIAEIEAEVPGVTAGANHVYRLQALEPDATGRNYAGPLIGWPAGGCRALRRVGMIDAGIAPDHRGIESGAIVEARFVPGAKPPAGNHGALMADLLTGAGKLTGTRLYSANVVDPDRSGGDASDVVSMLRAVDWLAAEGVDLVNVSLAGPYNKLLNRAMSRAAADGMVIVAAAGNLGPRAAPQYPAAFPFTVAVTAVDRDLSVYDRAVRGDHIDIAAPGVDILVQSGGRLRVVTGTSAAAPFVTAAIAADPRLRRADTGTVRNRLAGDARDLGQDGTDPVFGHGLLRAPEGCRAG